MRLVRNLWPDELNGRIIMIPDDSSFEFSCLVARGPYVTGFFEQGTEVDVDQADNYWCEYVERIRNHFLPNH